MEGNFTKIISDLHELHGDELESLLLKALDDVAHEAPVDSVRLDHDEGALLVGRHGEQMEDLRWGEVKRRTESLGLGGRS